MRASGILMPVFSLPGKYGIGCFSKEAYKFVDFLEKSGQKYWQMLPLGPTSYGDSPYQSFSTFAGNPYFIDLEELIKDKLLTRAAVEKADFGCCETDIDYAKLYEMRFPLLFTAYENSQIGKNAEFKSFLKENAHWIYDYAFFMALKDLFGGKSFIEWPEDIRLRDEKAMEKYERQLMEQIEFYEFLQYKFFSQWKNLKSYANEKGIKIIGDIPIYVAFDSADVWAHPEMFQMTEEGFPIAVAGCPPDGFSATGQLWGNPLYAWDKHEETGFAWWLSRIEKCSELYDVIRIDHFRGFDEYYTIPYGDPTAEFGKWEKGPGMKLFSKIQETYPDNRIIAEDLGYITDTVRQLVKDSGYPNMKVLEFAFDSRDSSDASDYLPYLYDKNCVVYTGTHDNETLAGWVNHIQPHEIKNIRNYVGQPKLSKKEIPDVLIRMAHACTADLCIIPMQDYLGLGDEARINQPSTLGGNWRCRFTKDQFSAALSKKILKLTQIYGR